MFKLSTIDCLVDNEHTTSKKEKMCMIVQTQLYNYPMLQNGYVSGNKPKNISNALLLEELLTKVEFYEVS